MATVYLLGAGASHGYDRSPTGAQPPLAAGLFEAYFKLPISGDLGVKIGWLLTYVGKKYGIKPEDFPTFRLDAEEFMTELEVDVNNFFAQEVKNSVEYAEKVITVPAYDQTLFLFTSVLNEISNGPLYDGYRRLVEKLEPEDTLATFNWDVLLDKALYECSEWRPDDGYLVHFSSIFDEGWRLPQRWRSQRLNLLKLHGSTNWLTRYISRNVQTGKRSMMTAATGGKVGIRFVVETDKTVDDVIERGYAEYRPEIREVHEVMADLDPCRLQPLCFVKGSEPFPAFKDRFRPGYGLMTYFYSPLDPNHGVATSPLIIAPVRNKGYEEFDAVLGPIWDMAREKIESADRVCVIGFSFPPTDVRARSLFTQVSHGRSIEIIDPFPDRPLQTLQALTNAEVSVVARSLDEFVSG